MDTQTITRLNDLLIGKTCIELTYVGDLPFINFGEVGLYIPSAWRVTSQQEIIAGSDSDDVVKMKLGEILVNRVIEGVYIHEEFYDLQIQFNNGLVLQTFANAERYEHWQVSGGPNKMIIAGPGRSWSNF